MVCRINEQGFQHSFRYKHERDCAVIFINGQQQGNMGQEGGHFITDGNAIGQRQEPVRGVDGIGPDGKGARCIVRPAKA